MAIVGSFGTTVFEVSSKKVFTFNDFRRSGEARWVEHEILSYRPIPEFIGVSNEQITMMVRLDTASGVDPSKEILKLRNMRDTGTPDYLYTGNKVITSKNKWVLTSIDELHKVIHPSGKIIVAELNLTFRLYPINQTTVIKKTSSKSVTTTPKNSGSQKVDTKNVTKSSAKPK